LLYKLWLLGKTSRKNMRKKRQRQALWQPKDLNRLQELSKRNSCGPPGKASLSRLSKEIRCPSR
jgi:hypothetical protein